MPYLASLAFAFAIGCLIPFQAAINNQLKAHLEASALLAALVSFAVGTLALAAVAMATERAAGFAGLGRAPPWQFLGGILGALFVFGTTLLAPRIGVASMMALIMAGQVLVSLLIDQQGWLGLAPRALTPMRAGGALLVVVGVAMVNYEQIFRR